MKYTAHEHLKPVLSLEPADYQAAGPNNGVAVDAKGFREALIELTVGVITGAGTLDVHVEDSPDNVTFTDITGALFTQKVAATDQKLYVGRIDLEGQARYLRVVSVGDGANAAIAGANIVLSQSRKNPVTQENTTEFNIQ